MSVIFRNGKYYDSEKEDIPEEIHRSPSNDYLNMSTSSETPTIKMNLTDYLNKMEELMIEQSKLKYTPKLPSHSLGDNPFSVSSDTNPSILIPKGGLWNELLNAEYKAQSKKITPNMNINEYLQLLWNIDEI